MYPNGTVYGTPNFFITTSCEIDIRNFPFDEKHCQLKYGSWMYTNDSLSLIPDSNILQERLIGHYHFIYS